MPILDDRLDQPCTNGHPEAQRISALGALQFRSALICADMADAAYANDPQWMLRTCMRLREFIVDTFNPFFECENADIFGCWTRMSSGCAG